MEFKKHQQRFVRHFISAPFIYGMIIPIVLFDICMEIYHRVCFPLYGLSYVSRGTYVTVDRHKLAYLNPLEKFNCMYCGYVNGLFQYAAAIAGATERYWCGIQHAKKPGFRPPNYHDDFLPYDDEKAYHEFLEDVDKK